MNRRKQVITFLIVFIVLAALVYLQVREWKRFDWYTFKGELHRINWTFIGIGVLLIHIADTLRALRWKVFLRPTRPNVRWTPLIAPQFVGFAGLALFGRPGEFVRPYLLAKKTNSSVASQMALWFVERAFDVGAVTIILAIDIFFVIPRRLRYSHALGPFTWNAAGYVLLALFAGFVLLLYALWKHGPAISAWLCRRLAPWSKSLSANLEHKLRAASSGLHTMHDLTSFLEATAISAVIWLLVAVAYKQVALAFTGSNLAHFHFEHVILLMGASVVGGLLQLPFVGGGSQLATIAVLSYGFGPDVVHHLAVTPELAVAAGVMFWLVTFVSVAPLGLVLARFEHVSLRNLSEAEKEAEANGTLANGENAE